jgi:beta-glucosidase-like glycosyl hydrolase
MNNNKKEYIPAFSGNPEDLTTFTSMLLADMTLAQLAYYAVNTYAKEHGVVTPSGYILPPAAYALDGPSGVSTDFPVPIHLGQSWNKELVYQVGDVIGNERRGMIPANNPNTLVFAAMGDVRFNPLCGRFYEGFAEDVYFVSEFVDAMGRGIVGEDGFYLKTHLGSKHYSAYHAEFDRATKTNYISNRSLREYQFPAFLKAVANKHIAGMMTSYGAINGIVNAYSPFLKTLKDAYPYQLYCISDFQGDGYSLEGVGNEYETAYAKTMPEIAARLIRVKSYSNNFNDTIVSAQDYLEAVEKNLLDVTRKDLEEHIRPQIEAWIRQGYFNQEEYPYASIASDGTPTDNLDVNHQEIALQAAKEGIVLLKNENRLLPLSKESRVMTTGVMAEYRVRPWYTVGTLSGEIPDQSEIAHAAQKPVVAMQEYALGHGGTVTYAPELSGKRIRIKSLTVGKYLSVKEDRTICADVSDADKAAVFEVFSWGQDGYSFCDTQTKRFLNVVTNGGEVALSLNPNDVIVPADNTKSIVMQDMDYTKTPSVFTYEANETGDTFFRYGAVPVEPLTVVFFTMDTGIEYYQFYTKAGNYVIAVPESGDIGLGGATSDTVPPEARFAVEVEHEAGDTADVYADEHDVAVVFVGAIASINASEMMDRKNIYLARDQITLVENVAKAFPQKTVVVIRYEFPLALEEIKHNPDVAAICYMPYAGQVDSYALVQTLYGENSPSGRLTSSWLKDLSTLPLLTDSSDRDPQYTINMKLIDPMQLHQTYSYLNDEDITWEFGYGLSYSEFSYENIVFETTDTGFRFILDVKNTGIYAGKEVIQVYASIGESAYKEFMSKRQLVGFAKTKQLSCGETQTVSIEVFYDTLRKWDVIEQAYFVESGQYTFSIGLSSKNIFATFLAEVPGRAIGEMLLDEPRNIWESCYGFHGVLGREISKKRSIYGVDGFIAVESQSAGDYVVLPRVNLQGKTILSVEVASHSKTSSIEVYSGSMESSPICALTFEKTDPVEYFLDEEGAIPVKELSYRTCSAPLVQVPDNTEDLFLVFQDAGIRIDSIKAI